MMPTTAYPQRWLDAQRQVAATKLPPEANEQWSDGMVGWTYWITDEFANDYAFWAGYDLDSGLWSVYLLFPEVQEIVGPDGVAPTDGHETHLGTNRELCLTPQVGCESLEHAFARCALWCRGASSYRATGKFHFNTGQD